VITVNASITIAVYAIWKLLSLMMVFVPNTWKGEMRMRMTESDYKQLRAVPKKNKSVRTIPESAIQAHIKHYLQMKAWFVFKNHQSLGSHKGVADLFAIKDGISLWLEVKTATGKLSEDQKLFRDNITSCGGNYFIVRSLDDVIELIGKYAINA
jgi:hypothetical protein